ncbi:hypothetical protein KR084_004544 [Drosophila pseudotakahashii]|nr:hypothetical protein KR084_004544 [Drosophila pseudotakahashii]
MSLKSSARIKKRRSEAAAATYPVPLPSPNQAGNSNGVSTSSTPNPASNSSNTGNGGSNPCQSSAKKHSFVGRNPNFDTDETKLLIQLWGDPKLQRTLITTHKKHAVICQLAAKMQEYGYHRSPEEITTRIKNLKCFYNRLKKDKECGGLSTDSEPSWKHFAEMDAIMTRPIFSVRPNEVPAPSLKYQLEQALEEHAERRKRRLENGEELSDTDNEEDDMLLSALVTKNKETGVGSKALEAGCLESDLDMNEESFSKRRKLSAEVDVDIGEALTSSCIKSEPAQEVETVAPAPAPPPVEPEPEEDDDCMLLPQPKEEPIDVDASDDSPNEKSSSSSSSSTLAEMLQRNKPSNLLPFTGANVIIPASITTTTASISSTTMSSTNAASKLQGGKISLVPTNFLMQSKLPAAAGPSPMVTNATKGTPPQQLQLLQSAINQGARLMISGSAAAPAQPSNAGLVATAPGGVKFVLVNAEQAKAAAAAAAVGKSSASLPLATAQAQVQAAVQQQQQKLQQSCNVQLEKEENRREKAREELQSKRHMTTMRILLRQLLNSQNEANEIQHNRLSLERERLDWEKSMGDRLLNLLPSLLQPAPAASPCSTAQRLQPPKLLFTTALPMGNGTVTMPHILTSNSLPKVITTTSCNSGVAVAGSGGVGGGLVATVATKPVDNDVQLVTPKQEKEA